MSPLRANDPRNSVAVRWVALLAAAVAASLWCPCLRAEQPAAADTAAVEVTEAVVKSEFSEIKVTRRGDIRSLWFVHDDGIDALESQQDVTQPHRLLLPYSHYMFASYLLRPTQEQVLLVGLGGGSMVHFLTHHQPELRIDVVEIDPAVVKIADEYFGVRSGGKVKVLVQDAFEYLKTTDQRYDAIYMDAFLEPSQETDTSGVPLRLKTVEFLKDVQEKLKPGGLVVFNVHVYDDTPRTLATIGDAFAQVYVFEVHHRRGLAVVGSTVDEREDIAALRTRAEELDRRFQASFSFAEVLKGLREE